MDTVDFGSWLRNSRRGDRCVYYRGDLSRDRTILITDSPKWIAEAREADAIGSAAWAAYEAGRVHLVRRRVADNHYEYIAERRDR